MRPCDYIYISINESKLSQESFEQELLSKHVVHDVNPIRGLIFNKFYTKFVGNTHMTNITTAIPKVTSLYVLLFDSQKLPEHPLTIKLSDIQTIFNVLDSL